MTAVVEKPKQRRYTDHEKSVGLTALAICSGNKVKAAKLASEELGYDLSPETVRSWMRGDPARYQRIREEVAPKLQAQLADAQQALAESAAELEGEALAILRERLGAGDVETKDVANIYNKAGIAGGIHIDKAQLLNDRPTQIVERKLPDILRALQGKGLTIEGTAEEIEPQAQIAEGDQSHSD